MATCAGVSVYDDYTPKELLWITEAKETQAWDHTSSIVSMIHNAHAKRGKNAYHFHPYRKGKGKRTGNAKLSDFKDWLVPDKKNKNKKKKKRAKGVENVSRSRYRKRKSR